MRVLLLIHNILALRNLKVDFPIISKLGCYEIIQMKCIQMNTVLREIRDAFTTRLSGAVDSVMFSHSDLISRWAGIVFESRCIDFLILLFCFVMSVISRTFFPLHILLWTAERMSDRKAVRSQAKQIATNVLKLCQDAVMRR